MSFARIWIVASLIVSTLLFVIGCAGIPEDVQTWMTWIEFLSRYPEQLKLGFVAVGAIIVAIPHLWMIKTKMFDSIADADKKRQPKKQRPRKVQTRKTNARRKSGKRS